MTSGFDDVGESSVLECEVTGSGKFLRVCIYKKLSIIFIYQKGRKTHKNRVVTKITLTISNAEHTDTH